MSIIERAKLGDSFKDLTIIDAHAHIGPFPNVTIREGNDTDLVKIAEYANFNKICISASMSITSDLKAGNDIMLAACNKYPDKILGYVVINPCYKFGLMEEVERICVNKNIIGIKIHPAYNETPLTSEKFSEVFEYADRNKTPILVHTFNANDVLNLEKMAEKYSNIRFIIGHSGAETGAVRAAYVMKTYKNVYGDIPVSYCPFNIIEYLCKNASADKLFFGTDLPLFDYRLTLGRVFYANISDEDKIKILGGNFLKMLESSNC